MNNKIVKFKRKKTLEILLLQNEIQIQNHPTKSNINNSGDMYDYISDRKNRRKMVEEQLHLYHFFKDILFL